MTQKHIIKLVGETEMAIMNEPRLGGSFLGLRVQVHEEIENESVLPSGGEWFLLTKPQAEALMENVQRALD